jgi:hypothetical protein
VRDPRRFECTICTAVAPDLVFTVRTYATPAAYDPIVSAQISTLPTPTQQLTAVPNDADVIHDRSQVSVAAGLGVGMPKAPNGVGGLR